MTLCTIGFFVLLALALNGNIGQSNAPAGPGLISLAKSVDLKMSKFRACVKENKYAAKIQVDEQEGQAVGGSGTPLSVIIGQKGAVAVSGAYPLEVIQEVIKKAAGDKYDVKLDEQIAKSPQEAREQKKNIWLVANPSVVRQIDFNKDPYQGNKSASVAIYEYSDLECPFCKRHHNTMKTVLQNNQDKIIWTFRHMPLDMLHKKSRTEAVAVECAGEQGKFWEFMDGIFEITPSNDGLDVAI